jgi:hypothetical protein
MVLFFVISAKLNFAFMSVRWSNTVLFVIMYLAGLSTSAIASPVIFTFSGSVDASAFGLTAAEPLVFQVAYDSSQLPYPGSNSDFLLPISMSVGGYVISEKGEVALTIQPTVDSFQMGAAGYVSLGSYHEELNGLINGYDVWIGSLTIVDNAGPIDMLNSTNLPTSADFITRANIIGIDIENFSGTRKITKRFDANEYTLTVTSAAPEPTTRDLALGGIAVFAILGSRRLRNGLCSKKLPGATS